MKTIEIPRFRYLQDISRFLTKLGKEVDESGKVLKRQQQLLASNLGTQSEVLAVMVFNVTPEDDKAQRSLVRKMKTKIDPELNQVVVPQMKKLESQYNLAEDLYAKLRAVEQVETQLSMAFPNRRGPEYEATINQIQNMKTKISDQLKICLTFLSDVANKHVPKTFQKYVDMIADLVNEHVIFKDSQTFLYTSVTPEGDLMFTAYIMLQDVANDEGFVAPHLYISIQWNVGQNSVHVDLNHEYEVPNKLIGSGEAVGSVGEAVKAISDFLELENFSSALGVVPLALQLNVDPTSIKPEMFEYNAVISKITVDERTITFKLKKEIKNSEAVANIGAQLYKELKSRMKSKNVRLTMKTQKVAGIYELTFNIVKIAEGGELSLFDLEFLRDRFDLNQTQLRKIANIVNNAR